MNSTGRDVVRGAAAFLVLLASVPGGRPPGRAYADPDAGPERGTRGTAASRPASDDQGDSGPVRRFVYLDEDLELTDLVNKARFFEEQDNWRKAFDLYQQVLRRAKKTTLMRLDERTFGNLRAHLRRRLAGLPAGRLHQYRLLYDGVARRLLEEALDPLSTEKLRRVAAEYFATSVGDDALDILGDVYREQGRWGRAVNCWRQVLEVYPDTDLPREALWAKVVEGHIALGERKRAREALARLEKLAGPGGSIRLAGRRVEPAAAFAERIARLGRAPEAGGIARQSQGAACPQVGGSARHVAPPPTVGPADARTWQFHLPKPPSPLPKIYPAYALFVQEIPQRRPIPKALLFGHPVSANGKVFLHDRSAVYCLNGSTGRLVWSYKSGISLKSPMLPGYLNHAAQETRRYQTACAIADGRVYAVLGSGWLPHPRVVALKVRDGSLDWSTPLAVPVDKRLAILGTSEVVVANDTVFVHVIAVNDPNASTRLRFQYTCLDHSIVALDARTGTVRWRKFLCTSMRGIRYGFPRLPFLHFPLNAPACDGTRLYIDTNKGVVAALDARTGTVIWATLYEKAARDPRLEQLAIVPGRRNMEAMEKFFDNTRWRNSMPLVVGNKVIFTPYDAESLFCTDAATGKVLWKHPRGKAEYVVSDAEGGKLYIVGRTVEALDVSTGRSIWKSDVPIPYPNGQPLLADSILFVPTLKRMYRIDPRDGRLLGTFCFDPKDPTAESGNLGWVGRTLVTVSGTAVNGFGNRARITADLMRRIRENPNDALAYFQLGEIYARNDEPDKAIKRYEQALAVCSPGLSYQSSPLSNVLRNRLYEHHLKAARGAARTGDDETAIRHARDALGYALSAKRRLAAKLMMVASYRALGRWRELVDLWQSVIAEEPAVEYALPDGSSTRGRQVARTKLEEIIAKHGRQVYATHEATARRLLSAGDRKSLELLVTRYPNSLSWRKGLLALGDALARAGEFRRAAYFYRRYLRNEKKADMRATAYARLVDTYLHLGYRLSTRRILHRMLTECPRAKVTTVAGRRVRVAEYVATLRTRPELASLFPAEKAFLPDLTLPLTKAWVKPLPFAHPVPVPLGPRTANRVYYSTIPKGKTIGSLDAATGKVLWSRNVPEISRWGVQYAADESSILVADARYVVCLDLENGRVEWKRALPPPNRVPQKVKGVAQFQVHPVPASRNNYILAGSAISEQGVVLTRRYYRPVIYWGATSVRIFHQDVFLERETGAIRWQRTHTGHPVYRPLFAEDVVVICTHNPPGLLALDLEDGTTRHHWKFPPSQRILGPPLLMPTDNTLLVVAVGTGTDNQVLCLDLQDGRVAWKRRIPAGGASQESVALVLRGGRVFYLPRRGAAAALEVSTGRVLWRAHGPVPIQQRLPVPLIGEKAIFLAHVTWNRKEHRVRVDRIDIGTGKCSWSFQVEGSAVASHAALSRNHVLVAISRRGIITRTTVKGERTKIQVGLPPRVLIIGQDDGKVKGELQVGGEAANAYYRPAWVVVRGGHVVVLHAGGAVGFGSYKSIARSGK